MHISDRATRRATPPPAAPVTAPVQLRLDDNPAQMLERLRVASARVRDTGRHGVVAQIVFMQLAAHTSADGVATVSAAQLARELDLKNTHVCRALRALAADGFVTPLERLDDAYVTATRHPRHRVGYGVPNMVAPPRIRPHVVR